MRIATYNVELSRDGPGLLLRDILEGAPDVLAAVAVIAEVSPDVLLVTGFDYDQDLHALRALTAALGEAGQRYDSLFAFAPNSGLQSGRDMNGDGRAGSPRDAQGYGEFAGQGGMALLSRLPVDSSASRDFSRYLWHDLPDALLQGREPPNGSFPDQRLSSTGHWDVSLALPDGREIRLWAFHATPPVFDGPEDRNGRRNHDEAAFWLAYLDGKLLERPVEAPFVLLGDTNMDPADGDGRPAAMHSLLSHPQLLDPAPRSAGGAAAADRDGGSNLTHEGDPSLDTADWRDGPGDPGNLRVDYVLPSSHWKVLGSGVHWPLAGSAAETAAAASRHRIVWVDVELP